MKTEMLFAERNRAEEALRESEQRFRRLLAATTDYIYTVPLRNGQASATYHGPGCETVTGYTPEEFQADPFLWYRIIYEEDAPAVLAQVDRILHNQTPPPLEHRIVHKDGSLRWIRNTPIPHHDHDGKLVGYDGLITDITSRKTAEIALQKSQEQLALVIQGSKDGIWDWDVPSGNTYFSPRWKAMLGYDDDELSNRFETWESLLHPDDRAAAMQTVKASMQGAGNSFELEQRLRHKDGSYRWILARAVILRDAKGAAIRMAGSHVDLTDRKLAAAQLQQANANLARQKDVLRKVLHRLHREHRELKKAQQRLEIEHQQLKDAQERLIQTAKLELAGTLAAGVAHQVKNPLMTISCAQSILDHHHQMLLKELRAPEVSDALVDIKDSVNRAATIIDDLLTLSSPMRIEKQQGDLNAALNHSIDLLKQSLNKNHVRVERRLAPDLRPVLFEQVRMEGVFLNLLYNAIQAMPKGGKITVTTRHEQLKPEDDYATGPLANFHPGDEVVIVEIQDTGTGIPLEYLQKVFDPFFTTKPPGVGTGLGLTMAKSVVDHHNGALDLRNAPEGGAIASVVLKL